MFLNSRYYRKSYKRIGYFNKVSFITKYLVLPAIAMMVITTIVNAIIKNYTYIYIVSGIVLAMYFSSTPLNRYLDYLKYGKVSISKTQLSILMKYLSPRQFEVFSAELFKELGYQVHLMPDGPDGGKDVILNDRIYVECKRYNSDSIGREICQKLLGAVEGDGMEEGILFTNGRIHKNALEFLTKTNRLKIWNTDTIFLKFNSIEKHKASLLLDKALKYKEPSEIANDEENNPK